MKSGCTRRIYNLIFAIFALTTCYFSYVAMRDFLRDYVVTQHIKLRDTYRQMHEQRHYELIQQGKLKEAEEYGGLSDHFILIDLPITMDVSADPAAQKVKWPQFRLRIVRENQNLIAVIAPLAAYVVLYFLVWQLGALLARYVAGDLSKEPKA